MIIERFISILISMKIIEEKSGFLAHQNGTFFDQSDHYQKNPHS